MLALAVAVLSTTAFALILRQTQRREMDQMAVMFVNYVVASALGFGLALYLREGPVSPSTPGMAAVAGVVYIATYLTIIHSMELRGVAIANAITRLSILIPMLAAVLLWHERPHGAQIAGAALALGALPLLSLDKAGTLAPLRKRQIALLLALFALNGAVLLTTKWFQSTGREGERWLYFGMLYGCSAVVSLVLWLGWSRRLGGLELRWGTYLGGANILTQGALIMALGVLPGAAVFPTFAALGLAFTAGFAAVAWKEMPGLLGRVGIAVAVAAVVLINL